MLAIPYSVVPRNFLPFIGRKYPGSLPQWMWLISAQSMVVKIPDMPVGLGPTGIPGNQRWVGGAGSMGDWREICAAFSGER